MKKIVFGILAHVDAGKTTLSEQMLYQTGAIRTLGRVDHQDTCMDFDQVEKERGITIYSSQASFLYKDMKAILLDTPGHVDFSAEMERSLQVLDYAVLVISGIDGVQSHTRTLWKLLDKYQIPTFLYVNKMDVTHREREELLAEVRRLCSTECIDFSGWTGRDCQADKTAVPEDHQANKTAVPEDSLLEEIATADDFLLEEYMENGTISSEAIASAIKRRLIYPVVFGAALKGEGVTQLLDLLEAYTIERNSFGEFGAKVFKITRDKNNHRETWLRVTSGKLEAKDIVLPFGAYPDQAEKVHEIRVYSGGKAEAVNVVEAGDIAVVTGLSRSYPGQGLGCEKDSDLPVLEPVLCFQVLLGQQDNPAHVYDCMKILEEEDPMLRVSWKEGLQEIQVELMGRIQLEVLQRKMLDRFGLEVDFGTGHIMYRETIAGPTIGHGHYEPLKHFADVVLRMEPLPANSGIQVETEVAVDTLPKNYQNQVLNFLRRREHPGVLTGSPITDIAITIIDGKSHKKHTEGGDFRRATDIALRDGLLRTDSVLLEPYYHVTLELPQNYVGRAMTDFEKMHGHIDAPRMEGDLCILTGRVPVALVTDYAAEVASYTGGMGQLLLEMDGFYPCHNADEVIEEKGYNFLNDLAHPYESIYVHRENPDQVPDMVREALGDSSNEAELSATVSPQVSKKKETSYNGYSSLDAELEAIFVREFGEIRRPLPEGMREVTASNDKSVRAREEYLEAHPARRAKRNLPRKKYILVDGYNVIFAWEELKSLAEDNLEAARGRLLDILSNYQGFLGCEMIVVFDAYKVKGQNGEVSDYMDMHVVYTREAQTADAYIAKATHELRNRDNSDVTVVSSDGMVQLIVMTDGAVRLSSREFEAEVDRVTREGMKGFHI